MLSTEALTGIVTSLAGLGMQWSQMSDMNDTYNAKFDPEAVNPNVDGGKENENALDTTLPNKNKSLFLGVANKKTLSDNDQWKGQGLGGNNLLSENSFKQSAPTSGQYTL